MKFYIFSFICLLATAAKADTCKHRIIFLPNIHSSVLDGGNKAVVQSDLLEVTAFSTYRVVNYLKDHRDLPLFSEQVSKDLTMKTATPQFLAMAQRVRTQFTGGGTFWSLSPEQKQTMALAGGDVFSLIFGITPELHRVVENDKVENSIIDKIVKWHKANASVTEYPPEISKLIFDMRENLALDQISAFFKNNPNQHDVALLFGQDHNFARHPDKFPPQCIATPPEFQGPADPNAVVGSGDNGVDGLGSEYVAPATAN